MADRIAELLVSEAARDKLGARAISLAEVEQLLEERYVVVRNPRRARRGGSKQSRPRRVLVGRTRGGRTLTLVIERTLESTTWVVVTGWEATEVERRILRT